MMASERDPHDIVPDSFWEMYDSLEEAAAEGSDTDPNDRKRCPGCGSIQITPRSSKAVSNSSYNWTCTQCKHTFDEPRAPRAVELRDQTHSRNVDSDPLPSSTEQATIDDCGGADE